MEDMALEMAERYYLKHPDELEMLINKYEYECAECADFSECNLCPNSQNTYDYGKQGN